MFLKKTAIITLTSLFLTVGCISISTTETEQKIQQTLTEQATKITELETELATSKADIEQKKSSLEAVKTDLEKTQKEAQTLNQQLAQQIAIQKAAAATPKRSNVVVSKVSKRDIYLDKTVLGQTEWLYINKAKKSFRARVDTGAATSSINAVNIQHFERDGKNWVRFNMAHDKDAEAKIIEARIDRYVKILQSSEPGEKDRRPVIKLNVRVGNITQQSEFTLTDRQHMDYAVLIGRSFIQDVMIVDVSQDYIHPKYQAENNK
ncbi:ATP-dependent zinc protease [Psychromonas sp. SR45-3]|uniref:ATP-dependent zinc protease family protein n=1 Tax=Psychromonas sp. SR45-3 TaxID=2760930 RepID=UPI0015F8ECD3|nr:ATP-dependent zinc protease [Psychromonas sp. SR45-3]MBB1271548.1 ATP-dependent zinc protease [Psychromonas sp. SR45-3]